MTNFDFETSGLESYMTDSDKEEKGVWLEFPGDRAFKVKRAHSSNQPYARALQHAMKPYRRQIEKGTLDNAVSERILREVNCRHIIIDWDGIKTSDGEMVPYGYEAAIAFFTQFDELFDDVIKLASDAATFGVDDEEEVAETLGEDSPGNSNTETRPRR